MDNGIGPVGCLALGESLMIGANRSLLTLRLDNNPTIGDEGVFELCKGLRTNKTLKVGWAGSLVDKCIEPRCDG